MRNKYWYGKEIEGRLSGIESLFVASDFREYEEIFKKFSHILIGTSLIDELHECKDNMNLTWDILEEYVDKEKKFFTIEAKPEQIKKIPKAMLLKCHILLWLDVPELSELKTTDSIKVCPRSHEMRVFTIMNGQYVKRDDYIHDRHDI